jgi:hypothetical protein
MYNLLLAHSNKGCTNAPKCYVIITLPALFQYVYKRIALYIRINEIVMTVWYVKSFKLHFIAIILEYNKVKINQTN